MTFPFILMHVEEEERKRGKKKTHPKIRTNFERSVNELSTQGECKEQIFVGYNTSPSPPIRRAL
jgi:hypothetical protein